MQQCGRFADADDYVVPGGQYCAAARTGDGHDRWWRGGAVGADAQHVDADADARGRRGEVPVCGVESGDGRWRGEAAGDDADFECEL